MSSAKLYRVRVTQIQESFTTVRIADLWVAANSRAEAIKRAKNRVYITVSDARLHVHVVCETGGTYHTKSVHLQVQP